jgi:hypothetical protein
MRKFTDHGDLIEVMTGQTRAWSEHANTFDVLGRYENRLQPVTFEYHNSFNARPHAGDLRSRPAQGL